MQSNKGGRNDVFDWLRTVAIIIVLVVHAVPGYDKTNTEKFVVDWLTTVVQNGLMSSAAALAYYRMKVQSEGADEQELAAVFD